MHALEWLMSAGALLAALGILSGAAIAHTQELETFGASLGEKWGQLECSEKLDAYTTHFARTLQGECHHFPFAQRPAPETFPYLGGDANHYAI